VGENQAKNGAKKSSAQPMGKFMGPLASAEYGGLRSNFGSP
jgi:hypothetical protein